MELVGLAKSQCFCLKMFVYYLKNLF